MKKVHRLITSFVLITFDLVLVFKGDFFIFLLFVLILGGILFLHIVDFYNYLFYKHSFKNRFVCDFIKWNWLIWENIYYYFFFTFRKSKDSLVFKNVLLVKWMEFSTLYLLLQIFVFSLFYNYFTFVSTLFHYI